MFWLSQQNTPTLDTVYPKVSLLLSLYVRGMKKIMMTRLSVCSLGVSCNEMIDTPMLLVVVKPHFSQG